MLETLPFWEELIVWCYETYDANILKALLQSKIKQIQSRIKYVENELNQIIKGRLKYEALLDLDKHGSNIYIKIPM